MVLTQLPARRAASLLLAVGALNLALVAFAALAAARSWNRVPPLEVEARLVAADGSATELSSWSVPGELGALPPDGARHTLALSDGSRVELRAARGHFEDAAGANNMLRVFQLAIPLGISALFLAAGWRLRRTSRPG